MKIIKFLSVIFAVIFLVNVFTACGVKEIEPTPTPDEIIEATPTITPLKTPQETVVVTATAEPNKTATPTPKNCEHKYTVLDTFISGDKRMRCLHCQNVYIEPNLEDSFKILAIGNAYSLNSIWHLWDVANDCGSKDIVVALLYISGASIDEHLETIKKKGTYEKYYRFKNSAQREEFIGYTFDKAILEEDWDIITIQQSSEDSPFSYTYEKLSDLISCIKQFCPETKIVWNMTWSYANSYNNSTFAQFGNDQEKMYTAIVDSVKGNVLTNGCINGIIPVGTAIQNVRLTHIGDVLNSGDGTHLKGDYGLYTASLTYYAYLTGKEVMNLPLTPYSANDAKELITLKTAVKNAIEKPYEITR